MRNRVAEQSLAREEEQGGGGRKQTKVTHRE